MRVAANKAPLQISGRYASSTNPNTWTDYRTAANRGHEVGFVLNGDGIVCIDIDHCLVGDELTEHARKIVERAGNTYIEKSRSGSGIHIWGYGTVTHGTTRKDYEVYGTGRFIATTGKRLTGSHTLSDLSELIAYLNER